MSKRKLDSVLNSNECQTCHQLSTHVDMVPGLSWARQISCYKCFEFWTICMVCRQSARMNNCSRIREHDTRCHQVAIPKEANILAYDIANDTDDGNSFEEDDNQITNHPNIPTTTNSLLLKLDSQASTVIRFDTFILKNSIDFFRNLHIDNHLHNLILKSLDQNTKSLDENTSSLSKISPTDQALHISYCNLAYRLAPKERSMLSNLVSNIIDHHTLPCTPAIPDPNTEIDKDSSVKTMIPTSMNKIRNVYLDRMISMLPRPNIDNDAEHAFISITELIRHVFALGIDCQPILSNNNSIFPVLSSDQCKKSQDHIDQLISENNGELNHMSILITDWHDDFEPNSQAKQNKGSVWVYTVTILGPPGTKNDGKYTYPIALGTKSSNHDHILAMIQNEIKELRESNTQFYHRGLKKMIPVKVLHLLSIADSPERRGKNYISLGNGDYTARWGYAANVQKISKHLPHCKVCLTKLLRRTDVSGEKRCSKCLQWNFDDYGNPLLNFPLPKIHPDNKSLRGPIKLTFDNLTQLIHSSVLDLQSLKVSSKECDSILKCYGINEELRIKVIEFGTNHTIDTNIDIGTIIPPHWKHKSGALNDTYIDAIMHLVFYGVAKGSINDISTYLKRKLKHSSFMRYVNEITSEIVDMKLDWCKVLLYKEGTFGAWVAENWLGYIKICKWVYGSLDTIAEDARYVPPTKPLHKWTRKENEEWLKVRGLLVVCSAIELKALVKEYINRENGPPDILPPKGGSLKNVHNVVNSMMRMISLIMSKSVTREIVTECERSIKIYLTMVHRFDLALNGDTSRKLTWVSKSNYLSLLNLPQQMNLYGPMRCYWEGGYRGEGLIQELKCLINNGLTKNWQKNTLKRFFNLRTLTFLDNETKSRSTDDGSVVYTIDKDYKRYGTKDIIIKKFHDHCPLSIIKSVANIYSIAIDKRISFQLVKKQYIIDNSNMDYFYWDLMYDNILITPSITDIERYCILLPKIQSKNGEMPMHDTSSQIYSCIDSQWNELTDSEGFISPKDIKEDDIVGDY